MAVSIEEREGTKTSRASDGQSYFTLTHAGRLSEGEPYTFTLVAAEKTASIAAKIIRNMFDAQLAREIAENPGKVIEWRTHPQIHTEALTLDKHRNAVHLAVRARLAFVTP